MAFNIWDVRPDTPINNFATLNPIGHGLTGTLAEGNLKYTSGNQHNSLRGNFYVSSGKWYWEVLLGSLPVGTHIGISSIDEVVNVSGSNIGNWQKLKAIDYYSGNGRLYYNNTNSGDWGESFSAGHIIGVYLNMELKQLSFYKNNTLQVSPIDLTSATYNLGTLTFTPRFDDGGGSTGGDVLTINFGQDPTFSGSKTPTKVYTDSNGQGRFFYEPPAGALALCTRNLATPKNVPAEYVVDETNQHLLTYNGNTQISKFSPYATDGYSINFDSNIASSQVRTPVHSDLEFGTNDFTVEFWLYHMGGDSEETIVSYPQWQGGSASNGTAWQIRLSNTDYLLTEYSNKSSWLFEGNHTDLYVKRHQWNHIVLQRNGTAIKIYCNGKPSSTQYNIGTGSITDALTGFNTNFLCIGGYSSNTQDLGGYITDFRIVNGTAVYTPDGNGYISAPNAKLTAITNTKFLLSVDSKSFEDSSGTNKTVTVNSSPSISDWSPYTSVNKQTGYALVTTENGGSFYFDGSGDNLSIGNNKDDYKFLHDGTQSFTMECWIYRTTDNNAIQTIFDNCNISSGNLGASFWVQDDDTLRFFISSGTGGQYIVNTPTTQTIGFNQWYHVCVTMEYGSVNQLNYYINGISAGTVSKTNTNSTSSTYSVPYIGSTIVNTNNFPGYIADFRIVKGVVAYTGDFTPTKLSTSQSSGTGKAAVSASDTKLLLQPFQPKDTVNSSFFNVTDNYAQDETGKALTYVGNAAVSTSSPYKSGDYGSFSLNENNYLRLASTSDFSFPGDLTMEAWIKRNVTNIRSIIVNRSDRSGNNNNSSEYAWFVQNNYFMVGYPGASPIITSGDFDFLGSDWGQGDWVHIAWTRSGTGSGANKFFVNGKLTTSSTATYDYNLTGNSRNIEIGTNNIGGEFLNGNITEVRVVKGQALYTADFIPPLYPIISSHYTTDGTDPVTSSTKQSITGNVSFLAQPGKVADSENVAAKDPDAYMKSVIWTGTGSDQNKDLGFNADLVWSKRRDGGDSHRLYDSIRGETKDLVTNSTGSESTNDYGLGFINSNTRLQITGSKYFGGGGGGNPTFVAWCWKAGGAPGATDENGTGIADSAKVDGVGTTCLALKNAAGASITPKKMSVNTKSGFSIIKWSGNNTSGATYPHGLSQPPEFIITKNTNDSPLGYVLNWLVWHKSINQTGYLNLTDAFAAGSRNTVFINDTLPSANLITTGYQSGVINDSGINQITYCWHSVPGYSAFGSYEGNGSPDGPFVYTGFKPAWVMIKMTSNTFTYSSWVIYDNARKPYNPTALPLHANSTTQEGTRSNGDALTESDSAIDFLSNGFKIKNNLTESNRSTDTYIYAAFAEAPVPYANAR